MDVVRLDKRTERVLSDIEGWAGFGSVLVVACDLLDGWVVVEELLDEGCKSGLLGNRAGVLWLQVLVYPADVGDADGAIVVSLDVGSDLFKRASEYNCSSQ